MQRKAHNKICRRGYTYLNEHNVTKELKDRQGLSFTDPCVEGSIKVSQGKLDEYLHGEEECIEDTPDRDSSEIDFDYELSNV